MAHRRARPETAVGSRSNMILTLLFNARRFSSLRSTTRVRVGWTGTGRLLRFGLVHHGVTASLALYIRDWDDRVGWDRDVQGPPAVRCSGHSGLDDEWVPDGVS